MRPGVGRPYHCDVGICFRRLNLLQAFKSRQIGLLRILAHREAEKKSYAVKIRGLEKWNSDYRQGSSSINQSEPNCRVWMPHGRHALSIFALLNGNGGLLQNCADPVGR